jgi:interferon gamma-inducible protein 30
MSDSYYVLTSFAVLSPSFCPSSFEAHSLLESITMLISQPPPPVTVQAYTESLCIDCKNFIDHNLVSTYHKLGPSVIDLHIVPFGNSKIDENKRTVDCQHGEAECDANTWEQCAVEEYDPLTYIQFFGCLETTLPMGYQEEAFEESIFEDCADLSGMDFGKLKDCHDNPLLAWMLQQKYAKLTPDHKYVPWVLINGDFFDYEKQDFFDEVCKAYASKGGSHPACSSVIKNYN